MLVLSRRKNEVIDIDGGRIVITVADIYRQHGRYVARIGIEAPREVTIHRREVSEAIAAELDSVHGLPVPLNTEGA